MKQQKEKAGKEKARRREQKRAARLEKKTARKARRIARRTDAVVARKRRREFHRRMTACGVAALLVCIGLGGRFAYLALSPKATAAAGNHSSVSLKLAYIRNPIYDRNLTPLTDTETVYYLCTAPTETAVMTLSQQLSGSALESALSRLEQGRPAAVEVSEPISGRGMVTVSVPRRYSGIAPHVLGYLEADGSGAVGIEQDFDSLLSTGQQARVVYTEDAAGNILTGIEPQVILPQTDNTGVVLTLDARIQQICQEETETLAAGAVVVLSAETGEILAMVSRPDYDPLHVADFLHDSRSPLLNRCLEDYNIGSVFKPVIAAEALESGISGNLTVECTGSLVLGGRSFACHKADGHGTISFSGAIPNSCNVFFYTLAQMLEPEPLLERCRRWQLDQSLYLTESLSAKAGRLPTAAALSSPAGKANFSIGQGDLMLSPLAVAGIYQAIANNGVYTAPTLVAGVMRSGHLQSYSTGQETRICSGEIARKLGGYLRETLESGTGTAARPEGVSAAGKTATAQTGLRNPDGSAVHQAWFAGFFPAESPEFVVVVLAENAVSGSADGAPLFKRIADRILQEGITPA